MEVIVTAAPVLKLCLKSGFCLYYCTHEEKNCDIQYNLYCLSLFESPGTAEPPQVHGSGWRTETLRLGRSGSLEFNRNVFRVAGTSDTEKGNLLIFT